jgi:hypothetical protein
VKTGAKHKMSIIVHSQLFSPAKSTNAAIDGYDGNEYARNWVDPLISDMFPCTRPYKTPPRTREAEVDETRGPHCRERVAKTLATYLLHRDI